MVTLREWLTAAEFDWDSGILVYQEVTERAFCPGWASESELKKPVYIDADHPVLDQEFGTGYGAPQAPRFFAQDEGYIYFPGQYDGATWLERIPRNAEHFVTTGAETPYPGG